MKALSKSFYDESIDKKSDYILKSSKLDAFKEDLTIHLTDLEEKYQVLQNKKDVLYNDFKEKEASHFLALLTQQKENIALKQIIDDKNIMNEQLEAEIVLLKNSLDARSAEIDHLKSDLDSYISLSTNLKSDNQALKLDLESTKQKNITILTELNSLKELYDKLIDSRGLDIDKISKQQFELASSNKKIGENQLLIDSLVKEKNILIQELNDENKEKVTNQQEVEKLAFQNNILINEKNEFELKIKESELTILKLEERNKDMQFNLKLLEEELDKAKKNINDLEINNHECLNQIDLLKLEKSNLVLTLDEKQRELDTSNTIKEDYFMKLKIVNEEKSVLESQLFNTETELKELKNKLFTLNENLLKKEEEYKLLKTEFEALNAHSEILEKQNKEVLLISYITKWTPSLM